MARLDSMPEPIRGHIANLACPIFEATPFVEAPPAGDRRVTMISTAGLHRRGDRPFTLGSDDYRVIPADIMANELVMSHVSTNFDRTGFQQDLNVILNEPASKLVRYCRGKAGPDHGGREQG